MDARARDRQKRAGARQRAHARQRGSPGCARPRAGRVRGKGHAEGASADAGGPGASRGVDLPAGAGTPRSAEGWRCLLQGQEQERLLTGISPFSPGGHTAVGNLTPSRRETLLLRGHPGINVSLK